MPFVLDTQTNGPAATTYVVSFTDITPPVRYDGQPWDAIQISQATSLSGTFTQIDLQSLSPVDTDPSNPAARNITTALATAREGIFGLTFVDANGGTSQTITQIMNQPSEIRPTIAELGAFIRARTVVAGSGGQELGYFSNGTIDSNNQPTGFTRPNAVEADQLIDQAVDEVLMQVGADIPDRFVTQARFATLLFAAQLVELTFYRNEVNKDQSAFAQYESLWNNTIMGLKTAVADEDAASPQTGFMTVPIATEGQARFQAMIGATNDQGQFDPSKLPVDAWYPRGPGGMPSSLIQLFPWLGTDPAWGYGDFMINELEYPS